MDWASGADRHQKTALQKNRAFFLERGRGGSARAAHARSAALVAISNRRGGGGENWVGGVCGQKLKFVGFFWKTYIFQDPKAIFKIHRERADTLSWY